MKYNYNYLSPDCNGCPYSSKQSKDKHIPIIIERNKSDVLLVFQAPGKDEWCGNGGTQRPAPIISKKSHSTAARLRNSFNRKHVQRQNYDIAEVVQCYPGEGNNGRDKRPSKKAITHCSKILERNIKFNQWNHYKKIVSFGKIANDVVERIIAKNNLSINHERLAHPSSYRLKNVDLDNSL